MLAYALMQNNDDPSIRKAQDIMSYDMVLRQSDDGRLCNVENTEAVTDSSFCIPSVLETGMRNKNDKYIRAAEINAEYLLHEAKRTLDGTLYHMMGTKQIWADSAAFLPYSLIITGHLAEGYDEMTGILDRLFLPEKGLYAHIWDEGSAKYIDGRAWGIGNGWILTGLFRTLLAMSNDQYSEEYGHEIDVLTDKFRRLLDNMISFILPDGGMHDVIDDSSTFEETETVAMMACAIYSAVENKKIEESYIDIAEKMHCYICSQIDNDGKVLNASSSPCFDRVGTSVECQAHVLMMETLRERRLHKQSH